MRVGRRADSGFKSGDLNQRDQRAKRHGFPGFSPEEGKLRAKARKTTGWSGIFTLFPSRPNPQSPPLPLSTFSSLFSTSPTNPQSPIPNSPPFHFQLSAPYSLFPIPYSLLPLFLLFLLASCSRPDRTIIPSFYHWETRLQLTAGEIQYLESVQAQRLYVKFFDVDWDDDWQQPVPMAEVEMDTLGLGGLDIIPAIFITNRTFSKSGAEDLRALPEQIWKKISELAGQTPGGGIREVQIDCDWTAGTREVYFAFLKSLKGQLQPLGIRLSATIRLHQLRYFEQTGVPPVDRGMLMVYNVGELEDWDEENSILTMDKARPYLKGMSRYPMPLDLALPAFRWGVLFRDGRFIRLIHGLDPGRLAGDPRFRELAPQRFRVQKSTYLDGYYLYAGDLIRTEACGAAQLDSAAALLRRPFRGAGQTAVAVYHLEPSLPERAPKERVRAFFKAMER